MRVGDVDEWLKLYRQHRRVLRVWNSVLGAIMFGEPDAGEAPNALLDGLRELRRPLPINSRLLTAPSP